MTKLVAVAQPIVDLIVPVSPSFSAYSGPLFDAKTCIVTPHVKRTQTLPPKTSK